MAMAGGVLRLRRTSAAASGGAGKRRSRRTWWRSTALRDSEDVSHELAGVGGRREKKRGNGGAGRKASASGLTGSGCGAIGRRRRRRRGSRWRLLLVAAKKQRRHKLALWRLGTKKERGGAAARKGKAAQRRHGNAARTAWHSARRGPAWAEGDARGRAPGRGQHTWAGTWPPRPATCEEEREEKGWLEVEEAANKDNIASIIKHVTMIITIILKNDFTITCIEIKYHEYIVTASDGEARLVEESNHLLEGDFKVIYSDIKSDKYAASSTGTAGCWGRLPLLISSGGIMTSSPPDCSPPYLQTTAEPILYAGTTNGVNNCYLRREEGERSLCVRGGSGRSLWAITHRPPQASPLYWFEY
uniref:Uncharacterized protein n=1 Tax=Oryza punctata TaxID=4537 RepID=A0A0E0JYV6_ORYPU